MLRRVVLGCPLRRKSLRIRNQRKRERTKDRFTPSHTKEPPLHPWFNAHMSRVLLQEYQRLRNMNRFTMTYDEKVRQEFVEAAEKYSLFKLHQYYGDYERLQAMNAVMDAALEQVETLPSHLQADVSNFDSPRNKYRRNPESASFYRYFDQMVKIYPQTLSTNIIAVKRLLEIANDQIKFHHS